jgi:hypothetical protein
VAILVQDLINQALLDMHSIAQGEAPNATESAVALAQLNRILSSLSLDGTFVYNQAVAQFALTGGVGGYTMGSGGAWNTATRPVKVKGAVVTYSGLRQGLRVLPMGVFEQAIAYQDKPAVIEYLTNGQPVSPTLLAWATAAMPTILGEDSAAPLKNVRVHPVPAAGATIEASYWTPLTLFTALTDVVTFPVPGYELTLINELTAVLAPSYGRSDQLQNYLAIAARSKARISEINAAIELGAPAQK